MATWLTRTEARVLWRDAPADDATLDRYLAVAKDAVLAYAPPVPDPANPTVLPEGWPLAQYMQARNMWNAGRASASGAMDGSEFGITTMPLDWQIKQIVRPQMARGAIL